MSVQKSVWPDFFPEGVPPAEAYGARSYAFRLVSCIPAAPADFLSTREEQPDRTSTPAHLVFATSFFVDLAAIRQRRERYGPLKSKRIAAGQLRAEMGRELPTLSRHHLSVWLIKNSNVHSAFATDAEVPCSP